MTTRVSDPTKLNRYECRTCGYIYEPTDGDPYRKIQVGTAFEDIPDEWGCPVCQSGKGRFKSIGPKVGTYAGLEENAGFGWGVNILNPQIKNLLIFGALFAGFLLLMSVYFL